MQLTLKQAKVLHKNKVLEEVTLNGIKYVYCDDSKDMFDNTDPTAEIVYSIQKQNLYEKDLLCNNQQLLAEFVQNLLKGEEVDLTKYGRKIDADGEVLINGIDF